MKEKFLSRVHKASASIQYIILNGLPKDFPIELFERMLDWKEIKKSPYGHSYYSHDKTWNTTSEGNYRISDHWNFTSEERKHCVTSLPVINDTHWTLAIYENGLYKPLITIKKSEASKKDKFIKSAVSMRLKFLTSADAIQKSTGLTDQRKRSLIDGLPARHKHIIDSLNVSLDKFDINTRQVLNKYLSNIYI